MRWYSLLGVAGLLVLGSACSLGHRHPSSGNVIIDDEPVGSDTISFYFPADADRESSEEAARSAADRAELEVREIESRVDDEEDTLRVRLRTSVSHRSGFLQRRIDRKVVSGLGGEGALLLDVAPSGRLVSTGQQVESNFLERTFEVPPDESVEYEFSGLYLASSIGAVLMLLLLVRLATTRFVARVRGAGDEPVDQLHKLQRFMAITMLALPLVVLPLVVLGGIRDVPAILIGEIFPTPPEMVMYLITMLLIIVLLIAVILLAVLPVHSFYRELREIKEARKDSRRKVIRGLAIGLAVPAVWITALSVLDANTHLQGWTSALLRIALLIAVFAITPMMIGALFGRADLDPQLRERLVWFARSHGVKVRDIRALKGRSDKHANALVAGVIPGFKYIFLTDYLIEEMDDEELLAVVAHEVGHAKKKHLLIKLAVPFIAMVVMVGLVFLLDVIGILDGVGFGAFLIAMPLVFIGSIVVLQGVIGLKLEHAADEFASETVGRESMIGALEKLADLNMTKRDSGGVFNLLTQHPSIDKRIRHLKRGVENAA